MILGVGLFMLEHMFVEQVQSDGETKPRSTKRRKTTPNSLLKDNDDDEYPPNSNKGGIGYAGDLKEDVCLIVLYHFPYSNLLCLELWST